MKKIVLAICSMCFALTVLGQIPTDNPNKSKFDQEVQAAVNEYFKNSCRVGLSMAVYENGKTHFYNYGSISRDSQQLATKDTLYEIGSITKTFTGTLLANALVGGKLSLDDDIRKYLPEPYPNLEMDGKFITLRHLSSHQSGLSTIPLDDPALFTNPNFDTLPFALIKREAGYDKAKYLQELHSIKLDVVPGSIYFKYSNLGPKLVSYALEALEKISYEKLLQRYITQPLRMPNTTIVVSQKDQLRLAKGYSPNGKSMPYMLANVGASGGLKSSTADMVKYVAWHLNETDPVIRKSHEIIEGKLENYARGLYWQMKLTLSGERKIWQSGGTYGMSSNLVLFPDAKIGFILLANESCLDSQEKLEKIAVRIFENIKKG